MLSVMRTTLDLDDDVLQAVKELAELQRTSAGKMVSQLVRKALAPKGESVTVRNGVPVMPRRPAGAPLVTMALVNELRDDPAEFTGLDGRRLGESREDR